MHGLCSQIGDLATPRHIPAVGMGFRHARRMPGRFKGPKPEMQAFPTRWAVARSVNAALSKGGRAMKDAFIAADIPNGPLGRIRNCELNFGVDYIDGVAKALGVEPWQALHPTLGRDVLAHSVQAALLAEQFDEHFGSLPERERTLAYSGIEALMRLGALGFARHTLGLEPAAKEQPATTEPAEKQPAGVRSGSSSRKTE